MAVALRAGFAAPTLFKGVRDFPDREPRSRLVAARRERWWCAMAACYTPQGRARRRVSVVVYSLKYFPTPPRHSNGTPVTSQLCGSRAGIPRLAQLHCKIKRGSEDAARRAADPPALCTQPHCGTSAAQVRIKCGSAVRIKCGSSAEHSADRVRNGCGTPATAQHSGGNRGGYDDAKLRFVGV